MSDPINTDALREGMRRTGEVLSREARGLQARNAERAEKRATAAAKAPEPTPEEPAETSLWQFAIRVPEGREADVTRLLNESGYEVYRAWPVSGEDA